MLKKFGSLIKIPKYADLTNEHNNFALANILLTGGLHDYN